MKKLEFLPPAQIASFLALLLFFMGYYLSFTLFDFLPVVSGGDAAMTIYLLNFAGTALGALLCPLFLMKNFTTNHNKPTRTTRSYRSTSSWGSACRRHVGSWLNNLRIGSKSLAVGVGFILLVTVPQIVVRSMGVEFWFGIPAFMVVLAISSGILYTLLHGLFFLSVAGRDRRPYRALLLAFATCGGILARYFSVSLLESSGLASDPPRAIGLVINIIKWAMTGAGVLCSVCFILLKLLSTEKSKIERFKIEKSIEQSQPALHEAPECIAKTDWVMIARLAGLSVVFSLINAIMGLGLTPFISGYTASKYTPHTLTVVAAVCICAFLAGRYSINSFLRWFLPPAIVLFILLPCLVLFEGYSGFILLMSTLASIFRFSVWIIFTVAIMECYAPPYGEGFWFFGLASVINFTNVLFFLGPVINRVVPSSIEFTVLLICISAAVFVFLSLRIIFPKNAPVTARGEQPVAETPSMTSFRSLEDAFRERGLTRREIEVATLLAQEGLGAGEIGDRLYISECTVNDHIASIYRKFAVRKRAEFMAMFVGK